MNQQFMGLDSRAMLISGIIAGVGIGLLSNIPLIACVNCLLFAWVWGGGIGAVYLYRQNSKQLYLTNTQGLVLGALAGIVGGLVGGLASLLLGGLSTAFAAMVSQYAGDSGTSIPNLFLASSFSILRVIGDIFLYGIIAAIGGLLATALIWKSPVAAVPPPPYNPPPSGPTL